MKERGVTLPYIHFTEQEKQDAYNADLVSFLQSRGEKVKRSGSEYEWKHCGAKITLRGNSWYHQYDRKGGYAIDFVRIFYECDYQQAVQMLIGSSAGTLKTAPPPPIKLQKPFSLPTPNDNMHRLSHYLVNERGIDREVVRFFAERKLLYEDGKHHNSVFVGLDNNGVPRHAHMRGTYSGSSFKGNISGSIAEHSFHYCGGGDRLYVFEAPIDMLSYITLNQKGWEKQNYVALCSVAQQAALYRLKQSKHITTAVLCLDNDKAGIEATKRLCERIKNEMGCAVGIQIPIYKDWNEDLVNFYGSEETVCQELQL